MKKYLMMVIVTSGLISGQAFAATGLKAGDKFTGVGSDQGAICAVTVDSIDRNKNNLMISGNVGTETFQSLEVKFFMPVEYGGHKVYQFNGPTSAVGNLERKQIILTLFADGHIARLQSSLLDRGGSVIGQTACTSFKRK